MAQKQKSLRLLAVFALLAAFLFGQGAGLQHFGQYGSEMHWLSDHVTSDTADAAKDCDSDDDGDVGALCDLSVLAATSVAVENPNLTLAVPMLLAAGSVAWPREQVADAYISRAPPGRGPPHTS